MDDLELRVAIRKLERSASLARVIEQMTVIAGDMLDECPDGDRFNRERLSALRGALKVTKSLCD